jgi:AmpD protein
MADTVPGPAATAPWDGGWYAPARRCPSPNFGPRPAGAHIDLLVLHSISLPPGEYGGPQVVQLFCNQLDWDAHPYFQSIRGLQVSAHFFIRRDNCNDDSIGIELEGLEGDRFEPAQYDTLASLMQHIASRYPLAHVAGHEHIAPGRKADPGPGLDWLQVRQGSGLPVRCFPLVTQKS